MESFWRSLKVEETHGRGFAARVKAKRLIFAYIEGFYNTGRMHSLIDWQSPPAFRAAFERQRLEIGTDSAPSSSEPASIERSKRW
jgi:transposase InsO family protein